MAQVRKKPKNAKSQRVDRELAFDPSESHPVVYSDYVSVQIDISGFKTTFCASWTDKSGVRCVRPLVTVGMSAEHASMLHRLLTEMIETYIDKYGKIRGVEMRKFPIPDEILQQMEDDPKKGQKKENN